MHRQWRYGHACKLKIMKSRTITKEMVPSLLKVAPAHPGTAQL